MLKSKIIYNAKITDIFINNFLKREKASILIKPMKYGTLGGGKKIRSSIIINTGKLFNIKPTISNRLNEIIFKLYDLKL